jgi:hypothetical protein
MSEDSEEEAIFQVEDQDNLVAREKKKMIIESRKQVNRVESEMILKGAGEEIKTDSLSTYLHIVRQFLRNIEVLLANSEIKGAESAYEKSHLGSIRLIPPVEPATEKAPDHLETDRPSWANQVNSGVVLHRFSDPVEPVTFEITGLKQIIESDGRTASWDVVIDKTKSRGHTSGEIESTTVTASKKWDFRILNNAIRVADQFLDNANAGFSLTEDEPTDGFLNL